LLFAAGVLASLSGRAGRRARVEARDEAAAIQLLTTVNLVADRGGDVDRVATEGLRELLAARVVRVVQADQDGELVVAQAGQADRDLDPAGLPHLDEEGRLPAGHWRAVGGTLVLPAQGVAVGLIRSRQRVGALMVVPEETGRCCAPPGWRSPPWPTPWPGRERTRQPLAHSARCKEHRESSCSPTQGHSGGLRYTSHSGCSR
jgi:hypothetical protein